MVWGKISNPPSKDHTLHLSCFALYAKVPGKGLGTEDFVHSFSRFAHAVARRPLVIDPWFCSHSNRLLAKNFTDISFASPAQIPHIIGLMA